MSFNIRIAFVSIFFIGAVRCTNSTINNTRIFPEGFIFGVATSAYQIEGAWNQDGKGESIWDRISHTNPSYMTNGENGDVACDSYNKWEQDLQLLEDLGVDSYRLSISWTRILPNGMINKINWAGVEYYSRYLDAMVQRGIEPMVTIYHWDLPQPLQELGGWANPLIVNYFADYTRLVFKLFGNRVRLWITINEPQLVYQYGYGRTSKLPALNMSGQADYLCGHNILKAHAVAYHIYQDEFKATQNGSIGISVNCDWIEPLTNTDDDSRAAETARAFDFGWFLNPIYNENYPQVMIDRIAKRSAMEGYSVSRLPVFTEEEIVYIRGTHDFLGLNYYTTYLISATEEAEIDVPNYFKDMGGKLNTNITGGPIENWAGFRKLLNYLENTYDIKYVLITENGIDSGPEMVLDDVDRILFFKLHLEAIAEAIEDGANVKGYYVWSFLDNLEWNDGYAKKYGLYQVDFDSANRTRTARSSASYYKTVIETGNHQFDVNDV